MIDDAGDQMKGRALYLSNVCALIQPVAAKGLLTIFRRHWQGERALER
jgi:hypothetical protein